MRMQRIRIQRMAKVKDANAKDANVKILFNTEAIILIVLQIRFYFAH